MKKLLPLLLISVCFSASAEWIPIACADKCEDAMWEYDPNRVTRKGYVIEVWIKASGTSQKEILSRKYAENPGVFPAGEAKDFQNNYSHSLNRFVINCKEYQFGLITGQDYRYDGTPLGGTPARSKSLLEIPPEALIDVVASKLCKKK
jgi:hypothetical protein